MRMLELEFRAFATAEIDLYPAPLRAAIDRLDAFVGPRVNGGVYRAGFAATQEAYDLAVVELFTAIDQREQHLAARCCLRGEPLTEADLRPLPTLVRFDGVHDGALRCNLRRRADCPHLLASTRRIHARPGAALAVGLDHVKRHSWDDHAMTNRRIGPAVEFGERTAAHAA